MSQMPTYAQVKAMFAAKDRAAIKETARRLKLTKLDVEAALEQLDRDVPIETVLAQMEANGCSPQKN